MHLGVIGDKDNDHIGLCSDLKPHFLRIILDLPPRPIQFETTRAPQAVVVLILCNSGPSETQRFYLQDWIHQLRLSLHYHRFKRSKQKAVYSLGHGMGEPAFDSWQGKEIFIFSKSSRPVLVSSHPRVQ